MTNSKRQLAKSRAAALTTLLWFPVLASAEWGLNLTQGVTPYSREVYSLHMLILWICVVIGVVVFGAMLYAIIKFRKSRGAVAAQWHESATVEIIWTIIPFITLIAISIPATKALIMMEDVARSDMTIKITGYQWKWHYDYIDDGFGFFSSLGRRSNEARQRNSGVDPRTVENYLLEVDNRVVVPVGKKIRFLTTAADVIHSWWVPALGWKRDAVPGFINESWAVIDEPGVYRGQCAELCGKDHGFMPIVLEAVPAADYAAWVEQMKAAQAETAALDHKRWRQEELLARGEQLYRRDCATCHKDNGEGVAGIFPALAGNPVAIGPLTEYLDVLLRDSKDHSLAALRERLSDADIAAVVTYNRQAWGNRGEDIVQPADVAVAREDSKI